jgi:hypothetical protein
MTNKLFEYIIQNGEMSEKKSVIDFFSKKDKVYTKKIAIPGDKVVVNGCKVKYLSITSNSGNFDDVSIHDIRANLKNPFGMWVNVYLSSLPNYQVEEIVKRLNIK